MALGVCSMMLFVFLFRPKKLEITEEPVYDLTDHPDFKYRPGSVVIRVTNFPVPSENDSPKSGSGCCGQVMDNCATGEVEVWWVDGTISRTWPQDLYKVPDKLARVTNFCTHCIQFLLSVPVLPTPSA